MLNLNPFNLQHPQPQWRKVSRLLSMATVGSVLVLQMACNPLRPTSSEASIARFDLASHIGSSSDNNLSPLPVALDIRPAIRLEGTAMHYRLLYQNPAQIQHYAQSAWVAPPADLLRQRLGRLLLIPEMQHVARGSCWLLLELDEFEQNFSSQQQSEGVIAARLSLLSPQGRVKSENVRFAVPSATANAQGGVMALSQASSALAATLPAWLDKARQGSNCLRTN